MTNLSVESIVALLISSDKAVERAMCALYECQTQSERSTSSTNEHNCAGFSAFHAKTGSYYARWVLSGRSLSGKHLVKAREMSLKYRKQLYNLALAKQASKQAETEPKLRLAV